jgi:hypothetical protein
MTQVFASSYWLNLDFVEVALDCLIELVQGTVHPWPSHYVGSLA